MLHVIRRLLLSPLRRMTSMHTQATVVSADASVSRRLRELASELDAGKYPDSCQIAAALQSLAQQLLSSQAPEPAGVQANTIKQYSSTGNLCVLQTVQEGPLLTSAPYSSDILHLHA